MKTKTAKIEFKSTPEFKQRVKDASALDNKTMTEYVTDAVLLKMSQKPVIVSTQNQER